MRYVEVKVTRDTNTVYNKTVPEWELPVLEFIFEQGNVELRDGVTRDARPYPTAEDEFDRLARSYGSDAQTNVPFVASVYGQAGRGIRALAKAIEQCKAMDKATADEPAIAPQARRKSALSIEADALLN
jgi:hypothetical protein